MRGYTVAASAVTLRLSAKWLENVLSRHSVLVTAPARDSSASFRLARSSSRSPHSDANARNAAGVAIPVAAAFTGSGTISVPGPHTEHHLDLPTLSTLAAFSLMPSSRTPSKARPSASPGSTPLKKGRNFHWRPYFRKDAARFEPAS